MTQSESELRAELARLSRKNAHLAACREISQRLLEVSTLEEIGAIVVATMGEVFGAAGAVMMLAAGPDPNAVGPWVCGGDEAWAGIPEATRQGIYDVVLDRCKPIVAPEAAAFLTRHDLPPAPSLRNLFAAPLRLGVLHLGGVIAYNVLTPENLPRYADDATALLEPVAPAVSHTWLLEAREKQAGLLESIVENAGPQIAYLDRDFRFLRVNRAYAEGGGHTVEELLGRKHFDLFPDEENEAIFTRVRDTGEPVHYSKKPFVYADQPERGVTYWDWTLSPVKDGEGKVVGLVLALTDRTEQVRRREQVRAIQQERLREARLLATIQESTDNNLVYFDRDLRIVQANSAFLSTANGTRADVLGKTIPEILPASGDIHELLQHARDTGEPVVVHEVAREPRPWRSQFTQYWDFVITPVKDEQGEVDGIVVSGTDVTGQVLNRDRLLEQERHRTRLAEALNAELNHRVKNNLAMVAGLLHMQIRDRPRGDEAAEMVRQTISRLRAIAAVHEQLTETQLTDVEIVDALHRIAKASRQILSTDHAELSVEGEPLFLPSHSATTLCVVVNELITNAVKHGAPRTDGQRSITITVGKESGKLRLGVWNSGNSLAEDFDLDRHAQMGLRLVHGIVVDQLRGAFSLTAADSGTLAQIVVDEAALGE